MGSKFNKIITDVSSLYKIMRNSKNFDRTLEKVIILSVGDGNLQAELKVEQEHTNPWNTLHGGFSSLLVDSLSSLALMSKITGMHVSVDIHMTFLKGAKIGDEVLVDCKTIKTGKTFAFCEVFIKNKKTGDLLVKGAHTKYIMPQK